MKKIIDQLKEAQRKVDKLFSRKKRLDSLKRKRWEGRFVNENRKGITIDPVPTDAGLKELTKYNIEYIKEGTDKSKEWMWENPGISYTPKKCFCMICGDTWTVAWIQYGLCPRFATCAKHCDFLLMGYQLKKIKVSL